MLAEHLGKRPVVDPEAVIAPTAVISGDVHIGSGSAVLAGAVITSQGAPVRIGQRCIVMENAVLRGAGRYPCTLGNHVLIGPHAHIAGATVNGCAFVATGASIFNGACSLSAQNGRSLRWLPRSLIVPLPKSHQRYHFGPGK